MAKGLSMAVALALAAAGPIAMAQSPPGSFNAGLGYVYPEIEFAMKRDTNIALQPDAARVGDTIRYVRPALRFDARSGAQNYDAGYRGEYARYGRVTTDDHDDHEVFAGGNWTLDARHNFKLKGQYLNKVDPRGALQIFTPTPSEYRQSMFTGFYAYGAQEAAGKLELQAGSYSKAYLNNRRNLVTNLPLTEDLDHSRTELGATLLLRVRPKTYATLTARQYDYDYTLVGSTKDSKETYLLAGLRWNVSAVISGRIGLGSQTKKFEPAGGAAGPNKFSGGAWEGGLNWKPLFYSTFDFVTQKRTEEATGIGDFVVNQTHQLAWTHIWGSRVTTTITTAYLKDSYSGTNRVDETSTGGARLLYAVQRWLKFGAEYAGSMRKSSDDNFDYWRNQVMLLANFTI